MTSTAVSNLRLPTPDWPAAFTSGAQRDKGVSAGTLEAYTLDISLVARWAALRGKEMLNLVTDDLATYVRERLAAGRSASTLTRHMSSCRRFYAFVVREGGRDDNPALAVRVAQPQRGQSPSLTASALRILLKPRNYPEGVTAAGFRGLRDHAIACVLYDTRLGVSDVRLLRWDQIDAVTRTIHVRQRNQEARIWPVGPTALAALRVLHREAVRFVSYEADSPYCFPTSTGLPLTRQALCHNIRKWARESGETTVVTPSVLRNNGRPVRYASQSDSRLGCSPVARHEQA